MGQVGTAVFSCLGMGIAAGAWFCIHPCVHPNARSTGVLVFSGEAQKQRCDLEVHVCKDQAGM